MAESLKMDDSTRTCPLFLAGTQFFYPFAHTENMPAVYTHHLLANRVFYALSNELQQTVCKLPRAYYFGAQGADFAFFYRPLRGKSNNFGSFLHRKGGYTAFSVLKELAFYDPFARSYALGFITHYAADTLFHPDVYALSKNSLLRHSRIENAVDRLLHEKYPHADGGFFRIKLTKPERNDLFAIYAVIAAKSGYPTLLKPSFLRAINLFNAYTPLSFSIFSENPSFKESSPFSLEKADKLLAQAEELSKALIAEFIDCAKTGKPLSQELFGKNYLTGK